MDTAISLHIPPTVKTQSAKICLNFNGGEGVLNQIPGQGCSEEFGQKFWKPSLPVHHRQSFTNQTRERDNFTGGDT